MILQDRIEGITQAADQFVETGHFDADNIKAKQVQLVERYQGLQEPIQARRLKLRDALRLQQFFRDVEDEEDWIREKEPIAASANRGGWTLRSSTTCLLSCSEIFKIQTGLLCAACINMKCEWCVCECVHVNVYGTVGTHYVTDIPV